MRRPLAILGAVLLSIPTFRGIVEGHVAPTDGATRFLVALALAWCGAAGLHRLVAGYGAAQAAAADEEVEAGDDAISAAGDLDPALG